MINNIIKLKFINTVKFLDYYILLVNNNTIYSLINDKLIKLIECDKIIDYDNKFYFLCIKNNIVNYVSIHYKIINNLGKIGLDFENIKSFNKSLFLVKDPIKNILKILKLKHNINDNSNTFELILDNLTNNNLKIYEPVIVYNNKLYYFNKYKYILKNINFSSTVKDINIINDFYIEYKFKDNDNNFLIHISDNNINKYYKYLLFEFFDYNNIKQKFLIYYNSNIIFSFHVNNIFRLPLKYIELKFEKFWRMEKVGVYLFLYVKDINNKDNIIWKIYDINKILIYPVIIKKMNKNFNEKFMLCENLILSSNYWIYNSKIYNHNFNLSHFNQEFKFNTNYDKLSKKLKNFKSKKNKNNLLLEAIKKIKEKIDFLNSQLINLKQIVNKISAVLTHKKIKLDNTENKKIELYLKIEKIKMSIKKYKFYFMSSIFIFIVFLLLTIFIIIIKYSVWKEVTIREFLN